MRDAAGSDPAPGAKVKREEMKRPFFNQRHASRDTRDDHRESPVF